MIRDDEKTADRLRTEDLAGAGDTRQAEGEEFRPTNDDFRSSDDDELTRRPVDADEFAHRTADDEDPYRGSAGTIDRDTLDTEPVQDPVDTDPERPADTEPVEDPVAANHEPPADTAPETEPATGETADTVAEAEATPDPVAEAEAPPEAMPSDAGDELRQMFPAADVERFRTEWQQVQIMFVDDPREAVQGADHLVAEVMQSLAGTFSAHKHELEGQWREGAEVQTEELRIALRRYRSFFNQLLDI